MIAEPRNARIVGVVGNGLSIAHNPDLRLQSLSTDIANRIDAEKGGLPGLAGAIAGLDAAHEWGPAATGDFERLVGPLDAMNETLTRLEGVADTLTPATPEAFASGTKAVRDYLSEVRRLGMSHALEVIAERSKYVANDDSVVDALMEHLLQDASGELLTLGNLNYDGLLLASALNAPGARVADLAAGYSKKSFNLTEDGWPCSTSPLRGDADFPVSSNIHLLSLHGSMTWLRERGSTAIRKFEHDDLRSENYWQMWREGHTDWEPQVILTNQQQKSLLISRWPFNLAYTELRARLMDSDRWLIAGYSFRDQKLNAVLRDCLNARKNCRPLVFVSMYGDETPDFLLAILLGLADEGLEKNWEWIHAHREGIESAMTHWAWDSWTDNEALLPF